MTKKSIRIKNHRSLTQIRIHFCSEIEYLSKQKNVRRRNSGKEQLVMSKRARHYIGIAVAVVVYYIVHEGRICCMLFVVACLNKSGLWV